MPVFGDGLQRVDLVHVDHLGRCLAQAATMPATNTFGRGQTWDAGSGYAVTVLDVAWWVASVTGNHTVEHLPMRVGEVTVSPEVVRADNPGPFGFDVTPFTEFERTVESYRP
jgi:nucleoside-diphosphate-sugar epimerase